MIQLVINQIQLWTLGLEATDLQVIQCCHGSNQISASQASVSIIFQLRTIYLLSLSGSNEYVEKKILGKKKKLLLLQLDFEKWKKLEPSFIASISTRKFPKNLLMKNKSNVKYLKTWGVYFAGLTQSMRLVEPMEWASAFLWTTCKAHFSPNVNAQANSCCQLPACKS